MDAVRMVHLRTVPNAFHARVIAARLGADGIMVQLRGAIGGVYPINGDVAVLVGEDDLETARELLLADEVEAAFDDDGEPDAAPRHMTWTMWMVAAMLVAAWAGLALRMM
jgi:Putative prokaryotic signal transducing protein